MNPNALDRTAAWLLNMNVQYLEQEGIDPDSKHREDFPNKEDLTPTEKVIMRPHPAGRQHEKQQYMQKYIRLTVCVIKTGLPRAHRQEALAENDDVL